MSVRLKPPIIKKFPINLGYESLISVLNKASA